MKIPYNEATQRAIEKKNKVIFESIGTTVNNRPINSERQQFALNMICNGVNDRKTIRRAIISEFKRKNDNTTNQLIKLNRVKKSKCSKKVCINTEKIKIENGVWVVIG